MRTRTVIIATLATLLLASCASTTSTSTTPSKPEPPPPPRKLLLDGETFREDEVGGFTSWECEDAYDGGPVVVEVGFFGAPGGRVGFVLFDGRDRGRLAIYQRAGLDHRWDWGNPAAEWADYSFVIQSDGTGLYYDFTAVEDGGTTSPSQLFECSPK